MTYIPKTVQVKRLYSFVVDEPVEGHASEDREAEFDAWLEDIKAKAWDEGAKQASPHGGAYLRGILIQNPHRDISDVTWMSA